MSEREEERVVKPSFGMVSFHRQSGGDELLFGTDLAHNSAVVMRVCHARMTRRLHGDTYERQPGMPIVEVVLTDLQFAELITSISIGDGVPGTIRWIEGQGRIEHEAEEPKRSVFDREVQADCRKIASNLDDLQQAISGTKMTVADKKVLLGKISKIKQDIALNMPFILSQFQESMDRTVREAKKSVEGYITTVIQRTGMDALLTRSHLPQLPEGDESKNDPMVLPARTIES